MVGMHIKEGTLKKGTPICVERRGQKDPTTGLQAYLDVGRVIGIEINRKPVEQARCFALTTTLTSSIEHAQALRPPSLLSRLARLAHLLAISLSSV